MTITDPPLPSPGQPGDVEVAFDMPTNERLDQLREVTDPLGDAAVAGYFASIESTDPSVLFRGLVAHTVLPPEEQVPAVQAFFEEAGRLPDWADLDRIKRGQAFFNLWVAHQMSALYMSSLPSAYAAAKGVQVLHMTARLQTDTLRRLNETGQFLMDISAPNAFEPGGVGFDRVLHVRLMHAAVRWLIANDPDVTHVEDLAPPQKNPEKLIWSESWGQPVNQEDLVGTLMTFTVAVYDVFDLSGVEYTDQQIEDHVYMWRVMGHLLGIDPAIVPTTKAESEALRDLIWKRQHAPSASGVVMTEALLELAKQRVPKFIYPMMPAAFRYFLGDKVADMLDMPPTNWTRFFIKPMSAVMRVFSRGRTHDPVHGWIMSRFGRWSMNAILSEIRGGDRPAFQIPTHLADDR
ncbi:MAG: oxygenase MpaB family protein [Actinomycetota bacterium]